MSGGRMPEPLKTTNDHIKRPSRRFRSQMQFRKTKFQQPARRRVDLYRNQLAKNNAFSSIYFKFRRSFNGLVRLFRSAPK
jgi:hypothetical protein